MTEKILTFSGEVSGLFYESFLFRTNTRTQVIYCTILIAVVGFLFSMPFINITLSVQGQGIIRPISEKTKVKPLVSEIIEQVYVHEGEFVKKGTPLLKLRTDKLLSKIQYFQFQKDQMGSYISDLEMIIHTTDSIHVFKSSLYQQEYYYYSRQNEELQNKMEQTRRIYVRNKKLFDNDVISAKQFDDCAFQYNSAKNEIKINRDNQISKWQSDLIKYQTSLKEINSNLEQVNKELDCYTIRAPISGNIEQFTGVYPGNTLSAGETVAVISPDSTLIAEIYISPKDIGKLNKVKNVKIQVDAFNYNEWGVLQGNIKNISSDFMMINNSPVFRVRCLMKKNYLSLKNGIKGYMKKGMTVRAIFTVTKCSLFQLLYQRVDGWMNPTQYAVKSSADQNQG